MLRVHLLVVQPFDQSLADLVRVQVALLERNESILLVDHHCELVFNLLHAKILPNRLELVEQIGVGDGTLLILGQEVVEGLREHFLRANCVHIDSFGQPEVVFLQVEVFGNI